MIPRNQQKKVKIVRIINLAVLIIFVIAFWLAGAPLWISALIALIFTPSALAHHYVGCSTQVLISVLLILAVVLLPALRRWEEFKEIDLNKDKFISLEEYQGSEESFLDKDKDKDGWLTRKEYFRRK